MKRRSFIQGVLAAVAALFIAPKAVAAVLPRKPVLRLSAKSSPPRIAPGGAEIVTRDYVRQSLEGCGWHWVRDPSPNPTRMEAWGCPETFDIWIYSLGAWITMLRMNQRTPRRFDERWDCGGCGATYAVLPPKCICCGGKDLPVREIA